MQSSILRAARTWHCFERFFRATIFCTVFAMATSLKQLSTATEDPREPRRQANAVSRLLKRLHVRGLIAKGPQTRRWQVESAETGVGSRFRATTNHVVHAFPENDSRPRSRSEKLGSYT